MSTGADLPKGVTADGLVISVGLGRGKGRHVITTRGEVFRLEARARWRKLEGAAASRAVFAALVVAASLMRKPHRART